MTTLNSLAIIPARGGSKGIPHKNILPVAGDPLIVHTVRQAHASESITRLVVSTDNPLIASVATNWGAEVVWRPTELSSDTAPSESALLHVLDYLQQEEQYNPDLVVFLQCTSPIRTPGDIDRAVQTLLEQRADSLLSVVPFHGLVWQEVEGTAQGVNYDYRFRPRRQDRRPEYVENGSIYVFRPWVLRQFNNRLGGKIALYEMSEWSRVDIDSLEDLELCEWILSHRR